MSGLLMLSNNLTERDWIVEDSLSPGIQFLALGRKGYESLVCKWYFFSMEILNDLHYATQDTIFNDLTKRD